MKMIESSLKFLPLLEIPELIIRPLISIDKVIFNMNNLKILSIGHRTEYEVFYYLNKNYKCILAQLYIIY